MLTVEYDDGALLDHLIWLEKQTGLGARALADDQMRLWGNSMIRFSPPEKIGLGRTAVRTDLLNIFAVVDQRPVMEFLREDIVDQGVLPETVMFNLEGDESEMRAWHEENRRTSGPRPGRVRYRAYVVKKLGNWKFVNKMYVPRREFRKYLKKRQSRVGHLKAGWIPGTAHYARLTAGSVNAPAWVRRQTQQNGTFTDRMTKTAKGFIEIENKTEGGSNNKSMARWHKFTLRVRQKDINKHMIKRVDQISRRFNRLKAA